MATDGPDLIDRSVIVTGATGIVGLPVAVALARRNEVWGIARFQDPLVRQALEEAGVRCIPCDLTAGDLTAVPRDVDHVVHLARPPEPPTVDFDAAIAAHAESVGLLMAHCAAARSMLHTSSTSLYRRGARPSSETDPLTDDSHATRPTYTIGKICAEAVVRTTARLVGLPTTIARLNVPYSDRGGWPALHLEAILDGRPVVLHERRPNAYNPIHTDDVIRTVPALLSAASVPATIVNWGGTDVVSIEEWAAYLAGLVEREVMFQVAPGATEPITIDTAKLVELAGPMTVPWREGMRRVVAGRVPDAPS
jgi:nucleoside-diphosphate-sugar epimerase